MSNYPKNSNIILTVSVVSNVEKLCLLALRNSFIQRKDIGSEYFEGNITSIMRTVLKCCDEYM